MPKTKISEFSSTPANNTDIDSIFIGEGMAPSNVNDAIRELMAQLKDFQTGAAGDSFNGPVGTTTAAAGAFTTLSATGNVTLGDASTDTLNVGNGGLIKDASGNLGLGVTPSAWNSAYKVLQLNTQPAVWGLNDALFLSVNQFQNTSGSNRYIANGFATQYRQDAGTHQFYTAPSGTAGNAITFTQAMTLDASGNLGVGATSPIARLDVVRQGNSSGGTIMMSGSKTNNQNKYGNLTGAHYASSTYPQGICAIGVLATTDDNFIDIGGNVGEQIASNTIRFWTAANTTTSGGTERARIDSSGSLLVGKTSDTNTANGVAMRATGETRFTVAGSASNTTIAFFRNGSASEVGSITTTSTATSYVTSSDYRLKEDVQPMSNALARVADLKPCTYKWKSDGSSGEGFIAHELQEVCPHAATGEKDAVDEQGNPVYQGIDTSFLVATLTAAIQEQQAIIESLKARLDAANL